MRSVTASLLQFSLISVSTAIAITTTTNAWSANLNFVSSRTALGENDFVNWSQPITQNSGPGQPANFTIASSGGLTVTGTQAGAFGAVLQQNPTPYVVGSSLLFNSNAVQNTPYWNGNFAPNDAVYWNQGSGPLTLTFATPVSAVGTQLDSLFYRDSNLNTATSPFLGTITAFYGNGASATFNANGLTNALANNSATFFGVSSDSADITGVVFNTTDIPTGTAYYNYAINGVSIRTTAVPEPFTIAGTLLGGAVALKMRKRLKAQNKL